MHPPVRNQADIVNQRAYSAPAAIDCSNLPDTTRQEFKREADVNYVLSRFGVNGLPQRQPSYGEQDFDLDLHGAYIANDAAGRAFNALPVALKRKYKDVPTMLNAMNDGTLLKDLTAARDMANAGASPAPAEPPAPEGAE